MDYTTKLAYQSNYWYNDGLNKANIRDLTGAITSLKKSLQYNRDNIASRNLLGLVYYGRGDVVEALAEWVLSKNLQPKENIANYYIQKVKEKRDDLDRINQAIKRYNQALDYCYQRCEDLAVMQLKKADASDVCESIPASGAPLHYGRTVCRSEKEYPDRSQTG